MRFWGENEKTGCKDFCLTENGTDAGIESRSKIYFDYTEQQGGKYDKSY